MPVHELRRGIGYVIQQAGLFPHRTVLDNIATVPRLLGWDKERQRQRSLELLELVGLEQGMADRYPAPALRRPAAARRRGPGARRRSAGAADGRAVRRRRPDRAAAQLQQEFLRLQRDLGKTVVFVTHDVDEAVLLGDRIAIMQEGGQIAQFGPPDELLAQPASDFVASFIGDTRGLKLLSLRSASDVPATEVGDGGLDGWVLTTDDDGRPLCWRPVSGDGQETPVESVGPNGSMRDLIDSAVASPARAAVRVDEDGKLVGAVPFSTLTEYLPAPQEIAAEPQEAR